jgi:hypothetical protein
MIRKRPHTIWRPLKSSLPTDGTGLGRLGYATGVVSIRRWIGKGYSSHHGRASSQDRGVAPPVSCATRETGTRKTQGGGPRQFLIYPSIIRTYYYRSAVSVQNCTVVLVGWVEVCGGMMAGVCSRSAAACGTHAEEHQMEENVDEPGLVPIIKPPRLLLDATSALPVSSFPTSLAGQSTSTIYSIE